MPVIKMELTRTVEVVVDYPLFKRHGSRVYRIAEDETIEVCDGGNFDNIIRVGKLCYTNTIILNGEDIPEYEFNYSFAKVLELIKSKSPK